MQKYDIFLIYKHFLLFHYASWQLFIVPVGSFSLCQLAIILRLPHVQEPNDAPLRLMYCEEKHSIHVAIKPFEKLKSVPDTPISKTNHHFSYSPP